MTLEKSIAGITVVLMNSRALLQDSIILFENKRYCRSFTLSQLAIEEVGKSLILFEVYISLISNDKVSIDFKEIKKRFTNHSDKSYKSTLMDFNIFTKNNPSKRGLNRFLKAVLKEIDDSKKKYNELKNQSLYVSYMNNSFVAPDEIISRRMAKDHLTKANNRYKACIDEISKAFSVFSSIKLNDDNSNSEFIKPKK